MKDLISVDMSKERISYKDLYEFIDRNNQIINDNIKATNLSVKETNIKLDKLSDKLEDVRVQTTKTNGRVNTLEQWECDINKLITEIRLDNKEQDAKIVVTSKELAMISVKVAGILSAIGFFVYILTGYII